MLALILARAKAQRMISLYIDLAAREHRLADKAEYMRLRIKWEHALSMIESRISKGGGKNARNTQGAANKVAILP